MADEAKMPAKIRLCDTMGFGVPYPGVAMPRSVAGIIYGLKQYAGVPSEMLEWHGHMASTRLLSMRHTAFGSPQ